MNKRRYLKTVCTPWNYVQGDANERLKQSLKRLYPGTSYLFGNARSAEYIFLKSLNLPEGSNVVIQAFTCNAVVNPILWLGLEPRYVDIDEKDFSMSLGSLKERVNENTKVIIVQHTFGIQGKIKEIVKFAKEKGIYVLEDTAHALGSKGVGNMGDASIVSFGVDKVLNTTSGGALVVNNEELNENIKKEYSDIKKVGQWDTGVLVKQPIFWFLSKIIGVGLFKRLGLINIGYKECELFGTMPEDYPRKLSNALSELVLDELNTLKQNLDHRRIVSKMYAERLGKSYGKVPLLWYPYVAKDKEERVEIGKRLEEMGYRAGDWYRPAVYPSKNHLELMGYEVGSCKVAEDIGDRIVGLQTGFNIEGDDVEKIVNSILGNDLEGVLKREIDILRELKYWEIFKLKDTVNTKEISGYNIEIQVFLDSNRSDDLRVMVSIDNQGLDAFFPKTNSFIIASDDSYVGE